MRQDTPTRRASFALVVSCSLLLLLSSGCAQRSALFVGADAVVSPTCDAHSAREAPLKVANYNIKSGMWSSLDEVGDVLEQLDADVIALEEVDNQMGRTGGVDQSAVLAERLKAQRVFAASWDKDGGSYGVALLSRVPIVAAERFWLPEGGTEPRAAIDATVCNGSAPLRVVAAHSDFLPWTASAHAEALAERVGDSDPDQAVLVMGDLNTSPTSASLAGFFRRGLKDALAMFEDGPTFGGTVRLDYILTNRDVADARIIPSPASDHFPVSALLQ